MNHIETFEEFYQGIDTPEEIRSAIESLQVYINCVGMHTVVMHFPVPLEDLEKLEKRLLEAEKNAA